MFSDGTEGLLVGSQEEIHACPSQKPMTEELTGPRREPTTILLLNGESIKLLSKCLSLYLYSIAAPRPHWRNSFVQSTLVNMEILSQS